MLRVQHRTRNAVGHSMARISFMHLKEAVQMTIGCRVTENGTHRLVVGANEWLGCCVRTTGNSTLERTDDALDDETITFDEGSLECDYGDVLDRRLDEESRAHR